MVGAVFSNVTLAEAAATLERYWPDNPLCAPKARQPGCVSADSFSLDQREELLRTLETVLPINVQRKERSRHRLQPPPQSP